MSATLRGGLFFIFWSWRVIFSSWIESIRPLASVTRDSMRFLSAVRELEAFWIILLRSSVEEMRRFWQNVNVDAVTGFWEGWEGWEGWDWIGVGVGPRRIGRRRFDHGLLSSGVLGYNDVDCVGSGEGSGRIKGVDWESARPWTVAKPWLMGVQSVVESK